MRFIPGVWSGLTPDNFLRILSNTCSRYFSLRLNSEAICWLDLPAANRIKYAFSVAFKESITGFANWLENGALATTRLWKISVRSLSCDCLSFNTFRNKGLRSALIKLALKAHESPTSMAMSGHFEFRIRKPCQKPRERFGWSYTDLVRDTSGLYRANIAGW